VPGYFSPISRYDSALGVDRSHENSVQLVCRIVHISEIFSAWPRRVEEEPKFEHVLPDWLKVLIVCSCWLQKQPALQLTSIATLLDLVALLKAHNDVETHPKSGEGVTTVIIVPLLKQWHVTYLMQYTNVFQVRTLASISAFSI